MSFAKDIFRNEFPTNHAKEMSNKNIPVIFIQWWKQVLDATIIHLSQSKHMWNARKVKYYI